MRARLVGPYRIRVVEVGQRFGCHAQVVRRGRVVHWTRVYPYGFVGPARDAALAWIQQQAERQQPRAGAR